MENLLDSKKEIFAHLDTIYANIEKAAVVSGRKKEDIRADGCHKDCGAGTGEHGD